MRNLVSRQPHSVIAEVGLSDYVRWFGLLTTPDAGHSPLRAIEYGALWAADNGCFFSYRPDAIRRMLQRYTGLPNCLFVVAPDVPPAVLAQTGGNPDDAAELTNMLFRAWLGIYQKSGLPIAYVAQNGLESQPIYWDSFQVLFIGGDNRFKYSDFVRDLCVEAKQRGKLIHHGRVNTPSRIIYSQSVLNADTFDGTHFVIEVRATKRLVVYQQTNQLSLF